MPRMSVPALIAKMEIQNRNAYLEAENQRLMERNAFLENDLKERIALAQRLVDKINKVALDNTENMKKISDLKTDFEDAQEHYDDYSALWNKMVDERDAEIERLRAVCSNIKHGKDAQIIALEKEVDELKAELAEEKAYIAKSLEYANAAEQQLITENYQLKTRIDMMTETYGTQTNVAADAQKSLAEKSAQLDVANVNLHAANQKLISIQNAALIASSYMAQVIAYK